MTSRSLRIRRGIWLIHETTITFENVQDVKITQGPLQRYFGIADLHLDTAGGGGGDVGKHGSVGAKAGHHGIVEDISDAARLRDLMSNDYDIQMGPGLGMKLKFITRLDGWPNTSRS